MCFVQIFGSHPRTRMHAGTVMETSSIRIVGLSGLAGSGKSTAAEALTHQRNFVLRSFAAPLKRMLRVLVPDLDDKEARPEILGGHTVRHALQTLGTNWGRDMIHKDIWTRAAMLSALQHLDENPDGGVVFDDVRFDNEARAILDAGGVIFRIVRPGIQQMAHESEQGLSSELVTASFNNVSSPADLTAKILCAVGAA